MLHLRTLFFSAILPELAVPRLHKGGIRELSEWLNGILETEKRRALTDSSALINSRTNLTLSSASWVVSVVTGCEHACTVCMQYNTHSIYLSAKITKLHCVTSHSHVMVLSRHLKGEFWGQSLPVLAFSLRVWGLVNREYSVLVCGRIASQ